MTEDQLSLAIIVVLLLLGLVLALYALSRVRERRLEAAPPSLPEAASSDAGPPPPVSAAAATPVPAEQDAASPFLADPAGPRDDLMRIKGIGPKLSARLGELGVFHYAQIAGWTPAQLAEVDAMLGNFSGRPERDQWQSQARLLASGDLKGYERAHGKLAEPAAGA